MSSCSTTPPRLQRWLASSRWSRGERVLVTAAEFPAEVPPRVGQLGLRDGGAALRAVAGRRLRFELAPRLAAERLPREAAVQVVVIEHALVLDRPTDARVAHDL